MDIPLIQIDAFAERVFEGNPAAVMLLPRWLDDAVLQQLAAENNLSETAFFVAELPGEATPWTGTGPSYYLRWFTPATEVALCGHATLATAGYLFDDIHPDAGELGFWTRSGWLTVTRQDDGQLVMDFPAEPLRAVQVDPAVAQALGARPSAAFQATDLIYVLDDPNAVQALVPDFAVLQRLPVRGVVVTAPGTNTEVDFVSRWFGAQAGVAEDPVTGSAHAQLAPYWASRLGRSRLIGRQLSARGGTVGCEVVGERVRLAGTYRRYLQGTVHLDDEDLVYRR